MAGIVNGALLLLILLVVGLLPVRSGLGGFGPGLASRASHPAAPVWAAAQDAAPAGRPGITTGPGLVTFYFDPGSAGLAPGAQQALADIVRGVAVGQRAIVSAYHAGGGDVPASQALAERRAQAVQGVLQSLGIGPDKIELRPPQLTTGGAGQAPRVEVTLLQ